MTVYTVYDRGLSASYPTLHDAIDNASFAARIVKQDMPDSYRQGLLASQRETNPERSTRNAESRRS